MNEIHSGRKTIHKDHSVFIVEPCKYHILSLRLGQYFHHDQVRMDFAYVYIYIYTRRARKNTRLKHTRSISDRVEHGKNLAIYISVARRRCKHRMNDITMLYCRKASTRIIIM